MAVSKPTIYYWGLKARAQLPVMILTAGKVDFDWQQDPGDYKSFAPFGQLPVLKVRMIRSFPAGNDDQESAFFVRPCFLILFFSISLSLTPLAVVPHCCLS